MLNIEQAIEADLARTKIIAISSLFFSVAGASSIIAIVVFTIDRTIAASIYQGYQSLISGSRSDIGCSSFLRLNQIYF